MITSEKYITAQRPITLDIDGRVFTVEPYSFNKGLHVAQLSLHMAREYVDMIAEGASGYLVSEAHTDELLDMLLGAMKFRGFWPGWACRAWIKNRISDLSLEGKLQFIEELGQNFTVALLTVGLAARRASRRQSESKSA